ncbi:MAG: S8 family serine peptidase [Phycisphaerales bacterium]|nr:S8 family serine peptidase [Phycisphaerales bacterium]
MRRIVVVDSGVDGGQPALRGRRVVIGPTFGPAGQREAGEREADVLGHGTAVAATIARFLPPDAPVEFVSLRVFERSPTCDFTAVVHALRHALALGPDVVNLSLGTTSLRHRRELADLAAAARARRVRLVAPASYGGLPCDPGALADVEAVVGDANVPWQTPELRPHAGRLIWFASPLAAPDADGVRRLRARGESLAVAAVSGCLLRSALG